MKMYRKRRLRPRVWAALCCVTFAAGIFCGSLCEAVSKDSTPEAAETIVTPEVVQEVAEVLPRYEYAGNFKITAYCACSKCCGQWANGITANGETAIEGITIAADTSVLQFDTRVMIAGQEYTVQDTGGAIKGNRIDIYMQEHAAALAYGVQMHDVYIIK